MSLVHVFDIVRNATGHGPSITAHSPAGKART
jgi:hypothetical protein